MKRLLAFALSFVFIRVFAARAGADRCPDGGEVSTKDIDAEVILIEPFRVTSLNYASFLDQSRARSSEHLVGRLNRQFRTATVTLKRVRDCEFADEVCPHGVKLSTIKDPKQSLVRIAEGDTYLGLAGVWRILKKISESTALGARPAVVRVIVLFAPVFFRGDRNAEKLQKFSFLQKLPFAKQLEKSQKAVQAGFILVTTEEQSKFGWPDPFDKKNYLFYPDPKLVESPEGFNYETSKDELVPRVLEKLRELACIYYHSSLRVDPTDQTEKDVLPLKVPTAPKVPLATETGTTPLPTASAVPVQRSSPTGVCSEDRYATTVGAIDMNLVWIKPRTLREKQARKLFNSPRLGLSRFKREIRRGFKTSAVHMVQVMDGSTDNRSCLKTLRSAASFAKFSKGPLVKSTLLAATLAEMYFKVPSARTRVATSASERQVLNLVLVFANGWGKEGTKKLAFNVEGPNTCKSDYPSLREVQQRLSKQHIHLLLVTTNEALHRLWSSVFEPENSLLLLLSRKKLLLTTAAPSCKDPLHMVTQFVRERAAALTLQKQ